MLLMEFVTHKHNLDDNFILFTGFVVQTEDTIDEDYFF